MMNLNDYIKNEFIKNKFNESSYVVVNSLEQSEHLAAEVSQGKFINIIFESSYLKDRFFSIVKLNRPDISIINCNSTPIIFENKLWEAGENIIYNNIHKCKDNITKSIINKKGMWVC